MKRVTISDVARAAGVSMKSVSRVFNREPNVTEQLRAKVQAAIDALGYVPEPAARSLAGGRAFALGMLFDNPSPHYTMMLQAGAYRVCRANGYHFIVDTLDTQAETIAAQAAAMLTHVRADGFILSPPVSDSLAVMEALEKRGLPYVRIAPSKEPGRAHAVFMDDLAAARDVADYLWGLGHRRFGFVRGPYRHGAARLRKEGFYGRLRELGADEPIETVGGFEFERGISAGLELMDHDPRPTAIFAANDDSAVGVMSAIAQRGLRVPDDVSVVGFDDSWIAQSVWPYLTTVHQPVASMSDAAAQILIGHGASAEPVSQSFPYRFVERASCAPPPRHWRSG